MTTCTRCSRPLTRFHLVNGLPFGRTCAGKVSPPKPEPDDLLTGIDPAGASIVAMGRVSRAIEASAAFHLAEMRASWRAQA